MASRRIVQQVTRLQRDSTAFLLCDIQERFRAISSKFEQIAEVSRRLVLASKIFKVPLIISEQYPQALGSTIPELLEAADGHATCIVPKTRFSMVVPEIEKHLGGVSSVVLFGLETHVCITQTALDLLEKGVCVHLVADATTSRSQVDRHLALARLRQAGAVITTAESAIFDLCRDKNTPEFKAIQPLVKPLAPDSGLLPQFTD